jgi:hypothetical protein
MSTAPPGSKLAVCEYLPTARFPLAENVPLTPTAYTIDATPGSITPWSSRSWRCGRIKGGQPRKIEASERAPERRRRGLGGGIAPGLEASMVNGAAPYARIDTTIVVFRTFTTGQYYLILPRLRRSCGAPLAPMALLIR